MIISFTNLITGSTVIFHSVLVVRALCLLYSFSCTSSYILIRGGGGVLLDSVSEIISRMSEFTQINICVIFFFMVARAANRMILESTIRHIKDSKGSKFTFIS